MKREEGDLQFICLQEHDRVCPLMSLFPSICVVCPVGSVLLLRRHSARREARLRQHLFVTDNRGPGRIPLKPGEVIIAGLCIEMCDFLHRLFLVELLTLMLRHSTSR